MSLSHNEVRAVSVDVSCKIQELGNNKEVREIESVPLPCPNQPLSPTVRSKGLDHLAIESACQFVVNLLPVLLEFKDTAMYSSRNCNPPPPDKGPRSVLVYYIGVREGEGGGGGGGGGAAAPLLLKEPPPTFFIWHAWL